MSTHRANVYVAACAFAASQLGDNILAFALALRSAELGKPAATVLVFLADLLPGIAFGSLAGRIVDGRDLRTVVLVGIGAQAALASVLALTTSLSAQIAILFAMAIAGLASGTGAQVILGQLGDRAGRQWTDSVASLAATAALALAPALGGLLYAGLHIRGVGFIDAASFLALAGAVFVVLDGKPRRSDATVVDEDGPAPTARSIRRRMAGFAIATADGIKLYRRSAALRASMPLILIVIFCTCLEGVAGVYYLRRVAEGRPLVYGLILASWSVGATAGSLLTADRLRIRTATSALSVGAALIGLGLCAAGGVTVPVIVAGSFLIGGLGNGIFNTAIRTAINSGVSPSDRGLAWGTFRTLSSSLIALGFVLGAPGLLLPARQIVIIAGVLPLIALLTLVSRAEPSREVVDRGDT